MLITMYAAMKEAGVQPRAMYIQQDKIPLPVYLVKVESGFMVDNAHPEWIRYVEKQKRNRELKAKAPKDNEKLLFQSVYGVLKNRLEMEEEPLMDILNEIERNYKILMKA